MASAPNSILLVSVECTQHQIRTPPTSLMALANGNAAYPRCKVWQRRSRAFSHPIQSNLASPDYSDDVGQRFTEAENKSSLRQLA